MFFGSNHHSQSESRHGYILGSMPNKKIVIPSKKFFPFFLFHPCTPLIIVSSYTLCSSGLCRGFHTWAKNGLRLASSS